MLSECLDLGSYSKVGSYRFRGDGQLGNRLERRLGTRCEVVSEFVDFFQPTS
jgi:hypothetical protein